MGNMSYWERRYLRDKADSVNKGEDFLRKTEQKIYEQAKDGISQDIEKIYRKYAKENKLSLAEAKKQISSADFHEIDWNSYCQYNIDLNKELRKKKDRLPGDVIARMEADHMAHEQEIKRFSTKGKITRKELLNVQINKRLLDLYDENQINMYGYLYDTYEDGYLRTTYNTQQGIGFGSSFVDINTDAVHKAIFSTRRRNNYSKTLYRHREDVANDIQECLSIGMIRGDSIDKMTSRVKKRMDVSYSNARRLVRTETAYVYEQAELDSYKECGITHYEFLATLDNRTSEICQELDGKKFKISEAMPGVNYPPMHPNCRSTTVASFEDDVVTERLAKDSNGKYREVPSDMTYKEWRKGIKDRKLMINGKIPAVELDDVNLADTHNELKEYLSTKYNINYDVSMESISADTVKYTVKGMESILQEYPDINNHIRELTAVDSAPYIMACNDVGIKYNKEFFNMNSNLDPEYIEYAGRHEASHLIEWLLIDKMCYSDKEDAWNNMYAATKVIDTAYQNILKDKVVLSRDKLISELGINAEYSDSECLADAVADYYKEPKKAKMLSKYIIREIRRWL